MHQWCFHSSLSRIASESCPLLRSSCATETTDLLSLGAKPAWRNGTLHTAFVPQCTLFPNHRIDVFQDEEKVKLKGEVHRLIAPRDQKHQSNFVEFRSLKIVYRRYAGLFFCVCVDANDNELAYLEAIHFFVEVLDSFFGNVCELDLVFNFYKVSQCGILLRLKGSSCGEC